MRRFFIISLVGALGQACGGSSGSGSGSPGNGIVPGTGDQAAGEDPCPYGRPFFRDRCWDEIHVDVSTFANHSAYLRSSSGETLDLFKVGEPFDMEHYHYAADNVGTDEEKFFPIQKCIFIDGGDNNKYLGGCTVWLMDRESAYLDGEEPQHLFRGSIRTKEGVFDLPISRRQLEIVAGEFLGPTDSWQDLDDRSRIVWAQRDYVESVTMSPPWD